MTRVRSVSSLALLAACVLSGACATTRYTQSRIEALPTDVAGRTGSNASVEIEGVKLTILVQDRTPEEETIRCLALSIVFDPDELGYSFDPGRVVLQTADGRQWRGAESGYVPLFPGATFDLVFGAPVEPGAPAELVIGGLARGITPIEPVSVVLARHKGRSIDRVYWLEAIAILLAGPYAGM
jgi:hypothetical protein